MPEIQDVRVRRKEFQKVRQIEHQIGGAVGERALRIEVRGEDNLRRKTRRFQGLYRGIVLAVSQRLAGRIRANESNWPVRTGYSRSRWRGNQEGLTNDASYAKQLEATRGEPALTFVTRNLQRELDKEIRNRDR